MATSGNIHRSPILSKRQQAVEKLSTVADYFLQHTLTIEHPQDDSVVKYSTKHNIPVFFRRSRGYAPNFIYEFKPFGKIVLAMGSQLKSTVTFCPNDYLYISQYLGDLENYNVYERFVRTTDSFISIFEAKPDIILTDKHPGYNSSLYGRELAKKYDAQLLNIQHHKAHLAAVLAENNLFDERVLGVVFDGTGYGDDGHIWGGEFFAYQNNHIKRIDHFEYFDWILGDKMSREPRISLLALANDDMEILINNKFSESELKTYRILLQSNNLKTSSVGRLFDAAASLTGITDFNTYEGEAAILLENAIDDYKLSACKNYLDGHLSISAKEIIKNMYYDAEQGASISQLIANFLYTLAKTIYVVAEKHGFKHIACSGGVFQNTTLIDMLIDSCPQEIKLYFHKNLSPNDENISFGQFVSYLHINET